MSKKIHVSATVNGEPVEFLCEARQSLLEVVRDTLRLTGAKEELARRDGDLFVERALV